MTKPRRLAAAHAVGLTAIVGALVGFHTRMTIPLDVADSTVEARIAALLVVGSALLLVTCYVLVPFGVATARGRRDGRWPRHYGLATLAVAGPLLTVLGTFHVLQIQMAPANPVPFLLAIVVLAVLTTGLVVAGALDRVPFSSPLEPSAWPFALNVAVVVLFVVGFVAVQPIAGEFADEHVDTYGGYGGPNAEFEVEERSVGDEKLLVTFTHRGGDPIPAERIYVRGDGFADVDGANHTGPGVWQGTVSGERPRRGGPAVVAGDSVTVGITEECSVVLVSDDGRDSAVVAGHHCEVP